MCVTAEYMKRYNTKNNGKNGIMWYIDVLNYAIAFNAEKIELMHNVLRYRVSSGLKEPRKLFH